jgi:hypothetical protein
MDFDLRPSFLADPATDGTRQSNFAILDFTKGCSYRTDIQVKWKEDIFCIELHIACTQKHLTNAL